MESFVKHIRDNRVQKQVNDLIYTNSTFLLSFASLALLYSYSIFHPVLIVSALFLPWTSREYIRWEGWRAQSWMGARFI